MGGQSLSINGPFLSFQTFLDFCPGILKLNHFWISFKVWRYWRTNTWFIKELHTFIISEIIDNYDVSKKLYRVPSMENSLETYAQRNLRLILTWVMWYFLPNIKKSRKSSSIVNVFNILYFFVMRLGLFSKLWISINYCGFFVLIFAEVGTWSFIAT